MVTLPKPVGSRLGDVDVRRPRTFVVDTCPLHRPDRQARKTKYFPDLLSITSFPNSCHELRNSCYFPLRLSLRVYVKTPLGRVRTTGSSGSQLTLDPLWEYKTRNKGENRWTWTTYRDDTTYVPDPCVLPSGTPALMSVPDQGSLSRDETGPYTNVYVGPGCLSPRRG